MTMTKPTKRISPITKPRTLANAELVAASGGLLTEFGLPVVKKPTLSVKEFFEELG
jgi:hypothetical protein